MNSRQSTAAPTDSTSVALDRVGCGQSADDVADSRHPWQPRVRIDIMFSDAAMAALFFIAWIRPQSEGFLAVASMRHTFNFEMFCVFMGVLGMMVVNQDTAVQGFKRGATRMISAILLVTALGWSLFVALQMLFRDGVWSPFLLIVTLLGQRLPLVLAVAKAKGRERVHRGNDLGVEWGLRFTALLPAALLAGLIPWHSPELASRSDSITQAAAVQMSADLTIMVLAWLYFSLCALAQGLLAVLVARQVFTKRGRRAAPQ